VLEIISNSNPSRGFIGKLPGLHFNQPEQFTPVSGLAFYAGLFSLPESNTHPRKLLRTGTTPAKNAVAYRLLNCPFTRVLPLD
jgi:hypothetical protein